MIWDYNKEDYELQARNHEIWVLERLINYGLQGKKIKRETLKKYLAELKIPEKRRVFLELILWNKAF